MSIFFDDAKSDQLQLDIAGQCLPSDVFADPLGIADVGQTVMRPEHSSGLLDLVYDLSRFVVPEKVKWSWTGGKLVKKLRNQRRELKFSQSNRAPQVGDCVLVKVARLGQHRRMFTDQNQYSRIYQGDVIFGVLGTRYATDAFYAPVIEPNNLHLLTNAGLIGTVASKHSSSSNPTRLDLISYLVDSTGNRINYKDSFFSPRTVPTGLFPIFTVGTGMNSGKTTSTARLGHELAAAGLRVVILKLTGSASQRDVHEYAGTGCVFTADFSDYGFPSTYLSSLDELIGLYGQMLFDASRYQPNVVLIEIADGIYQRETEMLLRSPIIRESSSGVVLTALCAASGLAIDQAIRSFGWEPIALTGLITNSPLFVDEFSTRSATPVCDTDQEIKKICQLITDCIDSRHRMALQ